MTAESTENFDLIVIGSGPAGEVGAIKATYYGKKVALIEKDQVMGGSATNTGTLSKTLREPALFLAGFRRRSLDALELRLKDTSTIRDLMACERLVKDNERARLIDTLNERGVRVFRGVASFADVNTVVVKPHASQEVRLRGERILIATGSTPARPALFPFHDPRLYDANSILTLHRLPERMAIIGGGVIGTEYACIFAALGVEVTLIDLGDRVLPFLDKDVSAELVGQMRDLGITCLFKEQVNRVVCGQHLALEFASGGKLETDTLLVSVGRRGNTAALKLENAGVKVDSRKDLIQVDEHYRTSTPHIYAAGDVTGFPALASAAKEEARAAVAHAFAHSYPTASIIPYGLYTIPGCAMVGATEQELQKRGVPYVAGHASYTSNILGQIIGERGGFIKLLFGTSGHTAPGSDLPLLGAHMIGEGATEVIHVAVTVLLAEAGTQLFLRTCYNYPTLGGLYKVATYDALNRFDRAHQAP